MGPATADSGTHEHRRQAQPISRPLCRRGLRTDAGPVPRRQPADHDTDNRAPATARPDRGRSSAIGGFPIIATSTHHTSIRRLRGSRPGQLSTLELRAALAAPAEADGFVSSRRQVGGLRLHVRQRVRSGTASARPPTRPPAPPADSSGGCDGATDIVSERGDEGVARIKDLTAGLGAHSVIEAVGTQESMMQAIRATRPGGHMGFVGVNHDVQLPGEELFFSHVHVHGPAPVRRFLPDLIDRIWRRQIDPGKVFDLELPLQEAADGYRAMDSRQAIKVLLRP
jgi:hypothetical protein